MAKPTVRTSVELELRSVEMSLCDLVGRDYINAVCEAKAFVTGRDKSSLLGLAEEKIEFLPPWYQNRMHELLDSVGKRVCPGLSRSCAGAATDAFEEASCLSRSPLNGFGYIRVGEDGRAYLTAKSEHYHVSLGHSFPGYQLLERAKRLGIPNATHNNTRGHITRLAEQKLISVANGLGRGEGKKLQRVLASEEPHVLNRIINLQTGSLAVEAGLKMMLARFYKTENGRGSPRYRDRTPVFLVVGDDEGGLTANYHGTTLIAQVLRGMWPGLRKKLEEGLRMVPLRINDLEDFERALEEHDKGEFKVAGFIHEIILMNYGGIRLSWSYLQEAYRLCGERDIPVLVDEIQSCVWSPELFLFREYGLTPDFVALGKGFPGGEYPASRILTTSAMDNLDLFGALVTNGQEEIASLAYLVTLAFAEANREAIEQVGEYYEERLKDLAARHSRWIVEIEGLRHLATLFFSCPEIASRFSSLLNEAGIDISAQTYKIQSPPTTLTKLPLIATRRTVDFLISAMEKALQAMGEGGGVQ